jgi:hypothetical protein
LIAGLAEHRAKLAILAEEQGRKLVSAVAGRAAARDLDAAAVVAVEALKAAFPEVRLAEVADEQVVIEGFDAGLRLIGEVDGQVGDALTIGFVRGALAAAAGAPRASRPGRVAPSRSSTRTRSASPRRRLAAWTYGGWLSDAGVRTAMQGHGGVGTRRPPRGPHRRRGLSGRVRPLGGPRRPRGHRRRAYPGPPWPPCGAGAAPKGHRPLSGRDVAARRGIGTVPALPFR